MAPGITATQKTPRIGTFMATSSVASSGPTTAPALSMAWWKPNARPALSPGRVGDQRVARGAPQALADAVGHANGQHVPRPRRQGHEGPHGAREPVAEEHQRLSPRRPVCNDARTRA